MPPRARFSAASFLLAAEAGVRSTVSAPIEFGDGHEVRPSTFEGTNGLSSASVANPVVSLGSEADGARGAGPGGPVAQNWWGVVPDLVGGGAHGQVGEKKSNPAGSGPCHLPDRMRGAQLARRPPSYVRRAAAIVDWCAQVEA